MKQDGEQDKESAENGSIQDVHHAEDKPCTSSSAEEVENGFDDEDDEFGDFETAEINETESPVEATVVNESRKASQDYVYFPVLENIFNNDGVWDVEDTENQSNFEQIDLDYFLDEASSDSELPSVQLWNLLRVIEETNSLKFRWPSSNLSTVFLESIGVCEPNMLSMRNPENQAPSSQSRPLFAENPLMDMGAIDLSSLQVEPADFDWNRAGLVNPLRISSSDPIANLNCDFFQNSPFKMNGKSLLDDDLAAWGLDSENNKSNGQNGYTHATNNGLSFLSVDGLSEDAKELLNRLPNLEFMLSDRVQRLK
ncbi:unnamed protein product [Bursaphelenchus xylophilus]|uniref:(pine wood nematode) hypothetical protein n=1 Tax=Bursaphelenchus xylophilus TaxID=6326 RepID=A0A1I7S5U0_BURXY|nr:unnamed protein product [Bursaphelenchus xylophilus]CAG9125061.1 unnamed protein product [Bursaphelenchus xylophilus]